MINIIKKYNKHLKTGVFYTSSSLFITFIQIAASFLVLRWVGPEEIGIWQAFLIINTVAVFINLGIPTGIGREIPFLLGKGQDDKAFSLASTAKAYALFCSIITLGFMLLGIFYFYFSGKDKVYIASFAAILLILSGQFYRDYLLNLFRTNKAFSKLSKAFLIQGFFFVLLLPLIFYFHYIGYIIYNVTTAFISLIVLFRILPIKVAKKFVWKDFILLTKTGLPLFLMAYFFGVSKSFIKFAILHFGGVSLLGLFAPVFAIRTGINTLPKIISQYLYPKFSFKFGATNDSKLLWGPVKNISIILLVSLSILLIPVYYFMPDLINIFFPKYVESIFPCRMALISGVVFGSFIGVYALNSIKAYKERLIITISYLILAVTLPFLLPKLFNSVIEGIAWAIVLIDVFYFLIAFFITRKRLLFATKKIK